MTAAWNWLAPIRPSIPELGKHEWDSLLELSDMLTHHADSAPTPIEGRAWTRWLLDTRISLAAAGLRAPAGPSGWAWQLLAQFITGFHDLDLRDVTGPGHGAMILSDGASPAATRWAARLAAGEIVGIAATERHGGSRFREITTRARCSQPGQWLLTGEKCWISRLLESSGYVTFFRDPDDRISVAIVDAADSNLEREIIEPFGLGGCTWGVLRFHDVPIEVETQLLGAPGNGVTVFRRHFSAFRPLVTATALGTAAGVHQLVVTTLAERHRGGILPRIRDNALITLGQTHAEILAGLSAALLAGRLAANAHPLADLIARSGKAAGVDTANRVVAQLAPLIGATGFQRAHPIAKARADLAGLLYADGIHDSLYRSAGRSLLRDSGDGAPLTRPSIPRAA